uniref:(California timema) hypothetical protein n=1 Tax=Timema californicum TaxID=61474 RepID=A0A7R9P2B4_TIMCA|nr:unnamed protein product [Timema californicum]
MKERKWWSVPRVPALWRRSSAPTSGAGGVGLSLDPQNKPVISSPRPVSESGLLAATPQEPRAEVTADTEVQDNVDVQLKEQDQKVVEDDARQTDPVLRCSDVKINADDKDTSESQTISVDILPNISFSFFNDAESVLASTVADEISTPLEGSEKTTEDSLIAPITISEESSCKGCEVPAEGSETQQKALKQSCIKLEVRQERCDGSSTENIKILVKNPSEAGVSEGATKQPLPEVPPRSDSPNGGYEILRIRKKPNTESEPQLETTVCEKNFRSEVIADCTYASPRYSSDACVARASTLPPTRGSSEPSPDSVSLPATPPATPPFTDRDWESSLHYDSDYTYYELSRLGKTTTATSKSTTLLDDGASKDYEDLEYCQHRSDLSPRRRRATLLRSRSKGVKTRLGKAWKAVRGWWSEERVRIGDVIQKHAHAQAVKEKVEEPEEGNKDAGGEEEKIKDATPEEEVKKEDLRSVSATTRVVVLRRRVGKKRDGSRPSSRVALRRSRYFPEGTAGLGYTRPQALRELQVFWRIYSISLFFGYTRPQALRELQVFWRIYSILSASAILSHRL